MSTLELTTVFDIGVMEANMLVSSIPKSWLLTVKNNVVFVTDHQYKIDVLNNIQKPVKFIYDKLTVEHNVACKKYERWKTDLDIVLNYDDFLEMFSKR